MIRLLNFSKCSDFINLIFNKYTFRIKNLYKNLHNKIDLVNEEEFHESEDYEDYKLDKDDINNKVTDLKTMSNTIKSKNKNQLEK